MLRRILAFVVLLWALGFAVFAVLLPRPAGEEKTDGIVVVTGAGGRIERGVTALQEGWSKRLLVSGVDPEVKPGELSAEYAIPERLMDCCITLGYDAVDTRSNAAEAAQWAAAGRMKSIRLVTSDWHMRRAAFELDALLAGKVSIVRDAVPSEPKLSMLFLEYHKYLFGYLGHWFDL